MRYKTTIEVVTDADSVYDAADIAGEYLKGNINTGANLRIKTSSMIKSRSFKAALFIFLASVILGAFLLGKQVHYNIARVSTKPVNVYAIQPPLGTNLNDRQDRGLKKIWKKVQEDFINSRAR